MTQLPAAQRPFYIVLNAGSGKSDTDAVSDAIASVLTAAGRVHEILRVDDSTRIEHVAQQAVEKAKQYKGIVVAAGGDGTLNAVAQATLGSGCEFGVIPQGTFNYFGRTHGIPSDTVEATRGLLTARLQPVQVGLVNEKVFLVNASLGLYPQALEDREEQTQRHGRSRLVAAWAALVTIFRHYRSMRITLQGDGGSHELRTLTLFVGNNRLQLEQIGLVPDALEDGRLVAIVLRPMSTLRLVWLFVQGTLGTLGRARGIDSFALTRLSVTPASPRVRRLKVATDGEITWISTPIEFRVADEPLLLLTPVEAVPESGTK